MKKPSLKKPLININSKHVKKLKHVLIIALIVIAVLAAAFISARTVGNVAVSNITDSFRKTFMSSSNGGFPMTVDSLSINEIKPVGKEILLLYNDEAEFLTSSARTMGSVQVNASDCRTAVCSGRTLVYDTVKGTVTLLSRSEKLGETETGGRILTAALASDGSCAVASEGDDTVLSKVVVYSSSFKPVFEWNCADERIVDVCFSNSGKKISILAVGCENAAFYSRLVVFDTSSKDPLEDIKYDDCVMLKVCMTIRGRTVVVGDNQYIIYNKDYERIDGLQYSENQLSAVSFDENGNAVIAFDEFGGTQTRIYRYSASGVKTAETTVSGKAVYVCSSGSTIAVATGKTAVKLNKNGEVTQKFTFDSEPDSVVYNSGAFFTLEETTLKKYS